MTHNEVRKRLNILQSQGAIDRWKQVGDAFYYQADNGDDWHLYWEDAT